MRLSISAQTILNDMRYVREVLDEASHLGLSGEAADRIRVILKRRIALLEAEVSGQLRTSDWYPTRHEVATEAGT